MKTLFVIIFLLVSSTQAKEFFTASIDIYTPTVIDSVVFNNDSTGIFIYKRYDIDVFNHDSSAWMETYEIKNGILKPKSIKYPKITKPQYIKGKVEW